MLKFKWEKEFKETEIGEIPKDWKVKKLGEVVYIKQGKNISTLKLKNFGYPVFGANGLIGYTDTYHYEEPQVLIGCRGSCGIINWSFPKSFVNNNAMALLPKSIDKSFLYFFLQLNFISGRIDETITGTGQPQITKEILEPFLIFYPPLPEQNRIANVLSYFDNLIENKKRQNEILEKTAMAIFKNWFIDFEPFKNGKFVYNEELGKEIPKGWAVKKIGEIAEIIMGQSPPSKFYNEDGIGIPFIQGKGQLGEYTPQTTIFCSCDGKLARIYDILLTVRAPVGELNLADKEYIIGRGIASMRSTYWPFLFLYFNFNKELLKSFEKGTTYDAIVKEDIENFLAVIAPPTILQKFHSLVEPLFQKIILNQKQIMTLRKIRDTLLPLLVFGKLRVEEI